MKHPILIVDDDIATRMLLVRILERHGYKTLTAGNKSEALGLLSRHECQVVISDWQMGKESGLDLCAAIRSRPCDRYVYVILVTAKDDLDARIDAYAMGIDDFISKPFRAAELLSHLRVAERVISLESADTTIFALAKLAESRDPDTGEHLERVRHYAHLLANAAFERALYADELDASFVRLIYETSPLHDIGKVAIPDSILLKPGKLTAEEFAVMKTHTTHGGATLGAALARRPTARFLRMAKEIAESHHERWDGSGYPNGLAGRAIPLAGRIVAVADVYDALSCKRVYKTAMPPDKVRQIIEDGSGSHFEPELVALFRACETKFREIAVSLPDEVRKAAA